MIICNVIAIAIGKATIQQPNVGLQLPNSAMFGGLSHRAMLGTLSLGHLLGMGAILGLASRGGGLEAGAHQRGCSPVHAAVGTADV